MDILTGIGTTIGGCLGEVIIQQARYLFCFNSIVEDLEAEENNLKLKLADIKERVEREERNTKEIEKVVEKWLKDAGDLMADVQRLKAEIQLKESCLIGWCPDWGCRYSLSSKAAEKTSSMLKLQNTGKFSNVAHPKRLPGIGFSLSPGFMPSKATELGSNQLIEALKNENTNLVGLYGAGGIGKTTLATAVGQELKQQQVFDEVVIATVSQNPNILDVQTKLAGQLGLELKEVTKEERAKRLYLRFTQTKSKILVILDDVWKQHDLKNEFGIPVDDNLNGRKILLTTRRKQVCDRMGCNSSIPLGFLKPEEGLALLKYHAGIDGHDSTLIDVSKEVAGECKGLPLAIVAVGSALRGKDVDEWKLVSQKLKTAKLNEVDDVDNVDVYACLKLSYDYVKDDNTKLCFLLCSLFPEDFEIDLEELVRCGVGLGWYQGVETIEEARSQLRGMIKGLKDSSLLLEADEEGFVKMHDVIRDVAMRIGSDDGKFFNGLGLTEWPENEGLKQYKAISLLGIKKNVLPPNGWVFPNLHTLLLGNYKSYFKNEFVVSDQFFEGLTTLKVVTIRGGDLSIKSLQFLTDLRVLQLIRCNVREMAFLGKLKRLQILCLEESSLDEIPDDLADERSQLKLLDLRHLDGSEVRISLIKRFSQLQEFYGRMTSEVEGTNAECLSKDFAFPQLQRYEIFIGEEFSYGPEHSRTNALSIYNTEATSLIIFSALYQNVQYLCLEKVKGCQNILSNIDQSGLKELTILELRECEDLECVMDVSQHVKRQSLVMLSRLATVRLIDLRKLQWIWKAPAQHVDLQNLTEVEVTKCNNLTYLFSLSQAQSLLQLRILKVEECEKLEHIIEAKIDNNERRKNILEEEEADYTIALPMLKELILCSLPNLTTTFCLTGIADEFVQAKHLELRNLTEVEVSHCNSLTYLFSLSQARSLVQLKELEVEECEKLEHIIEAKIDNNERRKNILQGDEYTIALPMLKELKLRSLPNLTTTFCLTGIADEFVQAKHLDLRNLTEVAVRECNSLTYLFSLSQARSLVQLRSLKVSECEKLEHIIEAKIDNNGRTENIVEGDEYTIALPMLEKLELGFLTNLTTFSSEGYFPTCQALRGLFLISCPRLTCGADEFVPAENLQYLRLEKVKGCQNILRSIDQRSFYELTTLIVRDCEDIECILDTSQRVGLQKTAALPKLRVLTLESLPNLTTFCSKYDHSIWPALQNLTLVDCPCLTINTDEFVQNLAENLQYLRLEKVKGCQNILRSIYQRGFYELTTLIVRDCEDIECLVDASQDVGLHKTTVLPKLRELTLEPLPNLTIFRLKYDHSIRPALQKLTLVDCPRLSINTDEFVQNLVEHLDLRNLTEVVVKGCNSLTYLFSLSQARSLVQLRKLKVKECEQLEHIIEAKFDDNERRKNIFGGDKYTIALTLDSLTNLTTLISCPRLTGCAGEFVQAEHLELRNLSEVAVRDCNSLTSLFSLAQARSLVQLKKLSVIRCERLEHIVEAMIDNNGRRENIIEGDEYTIAIPMLELESLPNLINFSSEGYFPTCQALQKSSLISCPGLTGCADQFMLAENLQYLRLEKVKGCQNILQSIDQKGFNELTTLIVRDCEDIECILDASQRVGLQKTAALPKLRVLTLESLPNLTTFCSKYDHSIWPALQELILVDCPRLTINTDEFVQNLAENLQYLRLEKVKGCQNILQSIDQKGFNELTTLIVRDCEDIECILDASQRVGLQKTAALPKLRVLTLESLPNLTTFCSKYDHSIWPALQELILVDCPRLTINTDEFVQNLAEAENLQYLRLEKVKGCQNILQSIDQKGFYELTTLIVRDCEDVECILDASQRLGLQKTATLPKLTMLTLESLPNLTTFCSKYDHSIWPALQDLTLVDCPRLTINTDEFVQNLAENLQYLRLEKVKGCQNILRSIDQRDFNELTTLIVSDCEDIECILDASQRVGLQKTAALPKLRVLALESLPNLTTFCSKYDHSIWPASQNLTLVDCPRLTINTDEFVQNLAENLTSLYVEGCHRLRHLLTPTLARNLLQLHQLTIINCSELEQIIKEDEEVDHLPPVCFPNLRRIDVLLCPKLKYLFHISVAQSLQKLEGLRLEEVDELEKVFWHKDGAVVMNDNKIVMTELWDLELKNLPNLTNCWPEGYQLTFPSLDCKTVKNCPKLRINFAAEELQTTSEEDASTVGDASDERNINENASKRGEAN